MNLFLVRKQTRSPRISRFAEIFFSKYPPAEPGALECEPLKAARKAAYAAYTLINSQGFARSVNSRGGGLPQLLPRTLGSCTAKATARRDTA